MILVHSQHIAATTAQLKLHALGLLVTILQSVALMVLRHGLVPDLHVHIRSRLAVAMCGACLAVCRSPQLMLKTIEAVLKAYDASRGSDSMTGQAGSLMNPLVIERMRTLQGVIRSEFT